MSTEGAYARLYSSSRDNILWGNKPGRLLDGILDRLQTGTVLDVGCGDGKNALFLEQLGFSVTGYDISPQAIRGLSNRFKRADWEGRGHYAVRDLSTFRPSGQYDVLVSYGLFHCLPLAQRHKIHSGLQEIVRPGGFMVFTCLTAVLPMPADHTTEGVILADIGEITRLFAGWQIESIEQGTILENHLPTIGEHQHSAIWIIARRWK